MPSNEEIEKEIVEKGLTAPRITLDQIKELEAKIVYYDHVVPLTTTSICVAFLDGFSLAIGKSGCIDPRNFDEAIGLKIARDEARELAVNKLWELEGYALRKAYRTIGVIDDFKGSE